MSKKRFSLGKITPIANIKKGVDKAVKAELDRYYKTRYEQITAPFDTDFRFEVVESDNASADDVSYNVRPVLEDIVRNTAGGGVVDSWILFNTLDLGSTGAAKVYLPDGFENESFPGSTSTTSVEYERSKIYVDSSQKDQAMDAREWSKLIRAEFENRTFGRTRAALVGFSRKALGIR